MSEFKKGMLLLAVIFVGFMLIPGVFIVMSHFYIWLDKVLP